jgi:hypothetical protein
MNQREASKGNYGLFNTAPTLEEINSGSLQRIADAVELMAKNHAALLEERDRYKRRWEEELDRRAARDQTISALRGVITKLKKKSGAA